MNTTRIALALATVASCTITSLASADPTNPDSSNDKPAEGLAKLTVFTSAGYLSTSGGNGGALATGVRLALGDHFALGLDLGYGLLALQQGTMQDRWWIIPSMAVVLPAHIGKVPLSFDIGAGLGLGTSSGYASWSTYSARPFSADWAFQLEPAVRAHAIAAVSVSRNVDLFLRADAAALILPQGSAPTDADGMWMMFALGSRFRLL
jgi:hypothetical protein